MSATTFEAFLESTWGPAILVTDEERLQGISKNFGKLVEGHVLNDSSF